VPRRSTRTALIEDLQVRHISPAFPRGQLTLIVAGAGLAGLLTSVTLLHLGMHQMWLRYGCAVIGAYLGFLGLLRLWIAWHRGWSLDLDPSGSAGADGGESLPSVAGGGRSGGAGGGAHWRGEARGLVSSRPTSVPPRSSGSSSWFGDLNLDPDDAWWLLVALVLVLGGALAVAYVIYIAPVLLAEVALDAALVTTVYRRLRPHDVQHWSVGVVGRTWGPATVLALCLAGAGAALQQLAPEARSIGGVIHHVRQ
jgi:hypothetical protein